MQDFFTQRGDSLTATHLYLPQQLPAIDSFDCLIVMGGPMGVGDTTQYPWLNREKHFIAEAIKANKKILGICLGAQLIAEVLGAHVTKNVHREIGWFPVMYDEGLGDHWLVELLPADLDVFHWHGDTFAIPPDARRIASSEACQNQGYILHEQIIGLQFHLETTLTTATALIENCRDELDGSSYVQSEAVMLADSERFVAINQVMHALLTRFLA